MIRIRSEFCQLRGMVPRSRCASATPTRVSLPLRSMSCAAIADKTVSGRISRENLGGSSASAARAPFSRNSRDGASLQWAAPSASDQNAPAASASSRSPAEQAGRRRRTKFGPAIGDSPPATRPRGTAASSASHASSSCDNSLPLIPRLSSCRAIALRRGSPGGGFALSSSSNPSRHQARRIAPSAGSVVVATTSASARSRFQRVASAGRTALRDGGKRRQSVGIERPLSDR